jgi:flagellar motor protein MotB
VGFDVSSIEYNRELSAKRANAVLNYMFRAEPGLDECMKNQTRP